MTLADGKFLGYDVTPRRILFTVCSFLIGYIFLNLARNATSPLAKIKRAPGWPVLRELPIILRRPDLRTLFIEWMDFVGDVGIFRYFNFLGPERITVFSPELIKELFVTKCNKFPRSSFVGDALPDLGKGIFTSNGADHSWQRKLMNPLFSFASVKKYVGSFDHHSLNLVHLWETKCANGVDGTVELAVRDDLHHLTLDIIGSTAFGYEFNSTLNGDSEVSNAFHTVLTSQMEISRRLAKFLIPFHGYLPLPSNLAYNKARKVTTEIIDKIIKSKKAKMERGERNTDEEVEDLLTVMMRAKDEDSGQRMTEERLKDNAWTFLLAGHDTTSTGLTWTLYELARNADVQEKAREEALRVIGNKDRISADMTNELEYIGLLIKESMRRNPPAGFLSRANPKREKLGDFDLPVNSFITIPAFAVHNYHKFWDDPHSFKPERFADTENPRSCGVSGQTYLPFGSGPRNCIGAKFANLEMKVVLARLLTKFRFGIRPDHPQVNGKMILTYRPHPTPRILVTSLNYK